MSLDSSLRMIVITWAAWFIGSCLISTLLARWDKEIIAVDDFTKLEKENNRWRNEQVTCVARDNLFVRLDQTTIFPELIIHMGARTDTSEFDEDIFDRLNLGYSKKLWHRCTTHQVPFIYASSAATYGAEEKNFADHEDQMPRLKPLNPYGRSKQLFDIRVLGQQKTPPFRVWLKFFNVYGPNEYHKGRMASVIFHSYNKIKQTGKMSLFRSHREDVSDGQQSRDFIYIKDLLDVLVYFGEQKNNPKINGIYNLGTGKARSFYDLTCAVFHALDLEPKIDYIDTPLDIRDTYQYFTQAEMDKLIACGYDKPFTTLEDGVTDYVRNYLSSGRYF